MSGSIDGAIAALNAQKVRPRIFVDQGQLRERVSAALEALARANNPPVLFLRGGLLARLREGDDGLTVEPLDDAGLLSELSSAADWYRHGPGDREVDVDPPPNIARAIRGARFLPLPVLDSVARAPFFTREGSLLIESGYYPDERTYLALDPALAARLQPLPQRPTAEDVERARALLLQDLFVDFPFENEASRAHAVGLALLPFVRNLIDGPTPVCAITAPAQAEGTGKTLLAHVACAPGLGEIPTVPESRSEEELKKFLLAIFMEGVPVVLLDNRAAEIRSGVLAAALTARCWQDRVLGGTRTARPRISTTWVVTGNAIRTSGEINRRTCWIRLNANHPEPWRRTGFKHELPAWAYQNRPELIRACLVLILNWLALGRPRGKALLGSFESWAQVIGGILEQAGIAGFLADATSREETNEDARRWLPFIEAWWAERGESAATPAALLKHASELVPDGPNTNEHSRATRLGYLLQRNLQQTFRLTSGEEFFVKVVRAQAEGPGSRRRPAYALTPVRIGAAPDPPSRSGRSGKSPVGDDKSLKIKENFFPDLLKNQVREGAQARERSGNDNPLEIKDFFEVSQTSQTSQTFAWPLHPGTAAPGEAAEIDRLARMDGWNCKTPTDDPDEGLPF
jgi:putative DNA primase/helicase